MAGKSNRRNWRPGGKQPPRPPQPQPRIQQTANANNFAALQSYDVSDVDELNPHLVERFTGSHGSAGGSSSNTNMQFVSKPNHDIYEYFQAPAEPTIGGSWLEKPEIPAPSEIMPGIDYGSCSSAKMIDLAEELRPNKIEGGYESNEEYLGTQYSLLREDAIRPLREAVALVRASPYLDEAEYSGSIGIYEPVYITSIVFSTRGLAAKVAFSLGRVKKHIRWDQSKRLITGTLVALSPANDCFQNKVVLAIVAARPLAALGQNPPEIDLFFARPEDVDIDCMKKWVMVESRSGFYEASRHTMLALQHMMREPFPLSEHLVKCQKLVQPPVYLQKNTHVDLSSLAAMGEEEALRNIDILNDWPSNKSHGLDKSQSQALRRILTSRLAIVQGPPGTGKTYVSVVALKILLANHRRGDPPIIVTCQTNHALDQLLRHVAEFESNFIRLGGRSKDKDVIKKRTLYEVRNSVSQQKSHGGQKSRAIVEMRKLTNKMQTLLKPLEANTLPLDHRVLATLGLITQEQAESLDMDSTCIMGMDTDSPGTQMELWLGKCLTPCLRPIQPDDFGMEFEEEDFEVEQLQELEAEAVAQDDDDFENLRGPVTLLSDNRTGRGGVLTDSEIREILVTTRDLTAIPLADRGAVYSYFQCQVKRLLAVDFRELAKKYETAVQERKIGQWEQDLKILLSQRLIGMTTTGLSKYRGLIAGLRPRVVLVEEAAETLEAPVTAACLPTLEHLVLVGDHQQLRPHCQVRDFEDEPYNFNMSLFERMVLNDIEIDCLARQRRMIPEIRRLLEPIYGKTLRDHQSVTIPSNRPPVEGMGGCNSFFFTHEWLESRDGNMSALNEREADMVVGFYEYLVLNGVDPRKVTVLTFYNGQRKAIMKRIRQNRNLNITHGISVATVDSYQGEENDIVLLSLVRSNGRYNIGFLSVDNRVCVALSRAKRGFYMFGNAEMLACESALWAEVVGIMYGKKSASNPDKRRQLGYCFPLECANHQRKVWIEDPGDWGIINGGCDQKCGCLLPCGHTCTLRCHPFDNSDIICTQKCRKRVEACGHACTSMCCDPCQCQLCDRRNDGMKPMLKHAPTGQRTSKPYQQPPPRPQPLRTPSNTDHSGSSIEQWNTYANGGAQEDDADFMRKARENALIHEATNHAVAGQLNASPPKLIETSPKKDQRSNYSSLLVDLGLGSPSKENGRVQQTFSYPAARTNTKTKTNNTSGNLGLLD